MASLKKLLPHERQLLVSLYMQWLIPTDQYSRRPQELKIFTRMWNRSSGRSDLPEEVLHYMVNERKGTRWVRFDGTHRRLSRMPDEVLTDKEWAILQELYLAFNVGSDNYAFNKDLAAELQLRFSRRAGRIVRSHVLLTAIMQKRKSGEWPTLSPKIDPFSDMDEVAE